jgi:hypothetical protein
MPRTTSVLVTVIAVIALTLLAAPAGATITTYTNSIAWSGATTNIFTIDFSGSASAVSPYVTDYNTADGLTINGVKIVGYTGETGVYSMSAWNPNGARGNWGSGDYLSGGYSPGYLLVTLPDSGSTAVSFNLMSYPAAKSVLVTLEGGGSFTVPTFARPTLAFWGFVSDTPITSVRLSTTGGYTGIDNLAYSNSDPPPPPEGETPEAQTFFLGGSGIAVLWLARRLRRYC